jgi:hypothetical protein
MDCRLSGVATGDDAMRVITFGRTIVVPVSLVVLVLAGFPAPPLPMQARVVLGAIVVIGLIVVAVSGWWQARSRVRLLLPMDDALQIAKNDASDVARMGSDAG